METKEVAQVEKNVLSDSLKNINELMDKYKELKNDEDRQKINSDPYFIFLNRSLANNLFLYFNHIDPRIMDINDEDSEYNDSDLENNV